MKKRKIPNYKLLYETNPESIGVESLHSEPLEERSSLHNWKIKSHRHDDLFQLFALTSGHAKANIDGRTHLISAPQVFAIPALCVHGFEFQPDTTGYVVSTFNYEVNNALSKIPKLAPQFQNPMISQGSENSETTLLLHSLIAAFYREYKGARVGRITYLRSLLKLILIQFSREREDGDGSELEGSSLDEQRFAKLVSLIEENYREHRSNQFYADELNITCSKLTQLTNSVAGQSPHEMLSNKILLEAKRYLVYTTMPLSQVTEALGMKDPAYFSRFFKKRTGVTPGHFRKNPGGI